MTTILDRIAGKTVAGAFLDVVADRGNDIAVRWKEGDEWKEWSFNEVADLVSRAASGLKAKGVERGDRIVLMMRNTPHFHVLDVAALMIGATPISIYNSSAPDQVDYLVNHSGAVLGIVEDDSFLARFEPVRANLESLRLLGVINPGELNADFTWEELVASDPLDLAASAAQGDPSDLATVIYTSGTTGPPKGVMISNANVLFVAEATKELMPFPDGRGKRVISYLPMAHIAERVVSHYSQLVLGYEVNCCPEPGKVAAYCGEIHPNVMFGVPRVWEKINAGVMGFLAGDAEKAEKFNEAIEAAKPIALRRSWGTNTAEDDEMWEFLDGFVFAPVRELLGLDRIEVAVSGAAPIPPDLLLWFQALGVPISEVYGMSENTGLMTWTAERIKPGTVGPAAPETIVQIAEDGEVICRGPHVFQGYLNDPEKTAEALSDDGWLHTGDIGELDEDGYLKIIDRKKELIITSAGKNIAPSNIENFLKESPLIGHAMAVGDAKPYVVAVLTLDGEIAPLIAQKMGIEFQDLAELTEHPQIRAMVQEAVDAANARLSRPEQVKAFELLPMEWTAESDELTPTLKLKRRVVTTKYSDVLERLYNPGV